MKTVIATNCALFLFIVCMFSYCMVRDNKKSKDSKEQIAIDSAPFVNGEILAPDYAHCDSLVVMNADSLNYIFDGVDLPVPATDSEIDSTLHLYCLPYHHECRWPLCPYKGIVQADWKVKVIAYTGCEDGSEGVAIDMLHLLTPNATSDELEKMLNED